MKPAALFAAAGIVFLSGCHWPPVRSGSEITRTAAQIQQTAERQIASPQQQPQQQKPKPAADPEIKKKELSKFDKMIFKYADWLYFAAYCIVVMIAGWYVGKTGRQSETLQQIENTISGKLKYKHKLIFRILRYIYKRKKVKK